MVSTVFGLYKLSIALVLIFLVPFLSFFALRFMLSGFSSPEKRSNLKDALSGFMMFLFSIPISYLLYATLIKLCSLASKYLLGESFTLTSLSNFSSTLLSILSSETLVGTYNLGTLFAMLTISIQRILLVLGAVTLPFSLALLFLTSSSSLKQLGQALLMFFGMVIFMPLIDSLIFQCAELAIPVAESAEFIVVSSYWLVGLVNLLVFFAAFSVSKTGSGVTLIRNIVKKS